MGTLNPLCDKNEGMSIPGGGSREDNCEQSTATAKACPESWKVKVIRRQKEKKKENEGWGGAHKR